MENTHVNRREMLKGMGLATLGGGAIAALTPTAALAENDHEGSSSPVGPWKITIVDSSPSPSTTHGVAIFNPGGGFETEDSGRPGVGLGRWVASGDGQFRGTFNVFAFDPSQTFQGTGEIRFKGRVRDDSLTGEFVFDIFDPAGNLVPGASGKGTISGKRFEVKPL
jgi:hypothetical protein